MLLRGMRTELKVAKPLSASLNLCRYQSVYHMTCKALDLPHLETDVAHLDVGHRFAVFNRPQMHNEQMWANLLLIDHQLSHHNRVGSREPQAGRPELRLANSR
jgi:hypothetical protein